MKTIVLLVLSVSMSSVFANTEYSKKLECQVDTFGIKTITILEDNSNINGQLKLNVDLKNGTVESRELTQDEFKSIYISSLYITRDMDLHITLAKKASEYVVFLRGDGYNSGKVVNCQ